MEECAQGAGSSGLSTNVLRWVGAYVHVYVSCAVRHCACAVHVTPFFCVARVAADSSLLRLYSRPIPAYRVICL